jgi:hypothetical protein
MPILFFALACADLADEVTPTTAALTAPSGPVLHIELVGYDVDEDGPIVAQLVEEVRGRPPTFGDVHAEVPVTADGFAYVEMPEPADDVRFVEYRLVLRSALADGSVGPIRELWPPSLVWNYDLTPGAAPAGWSVETHDRGVSAWSPVSGANVTLDFFPRDSFTVGGPFTVPDIATDAGTTVGIALMAGGEVLPDFIGTVVNGEWGLRLDGPPDTDSALLQPVAYVDTDGVLGFDPETEVLVGLGCVRDTEAFVQWIDEPWDVNVADRIQKHHQSVGWNALVTGAHPLASAVSTGRMRMDASCK